MTEMNDDFDRTMSYLSGDAQPADSGRVQSNTNHPIR